jgi:soluble P-type ATPase
MDGEPLCSTWPEDGWVVLIPSVVPACRSRRNTSKAASSTSPGTKLVASEPNATSRPSALSAAPPLLALACSSSLFTLTRSVVAVWRSRTNTSLVKLVSPAARLSAKEVKATKRPSGLSTGPELSALACVLRPARLTRSVVPATRNIPGHGAAAQVAGRRVAVGNLRLMQREGVQLGPLTGRREQLASGGRTVVVAAADGHPIGLFGIADAPRETSAAAIQALHQADVEVVMLTGDNRATAERIAGQLGIDQVIAEVLPGDKAAKVAELQQQGRKVAMVGDGVNDAPALAQADLGIAIGAGTDVAIETADVVLMRSDPLDVPTALQIGRGTLRKMRQNLGWAIGYNAIALPIAAGVFEPAFGLVLRPEIAALSMSGSSLLVAVNALTLRRLPLPRAPEEPPSRPLRPRPQPAASGT